MRPYDLDQALDRKFPDGSLNVTGSENLSQVGGAAVAVNSGAASSGTQRVVIATDQLNVPISGQFVIPKFDYIGFTYVGSTNNVATQVFKTGGSGGTTVATLTYAYVASGAADDDDVSSITRT